MNLTGEIYKQLQETYSYAKIPLADITLFKSIVSELVPKNMAKIWVAKYDDKVIGTIVTLTYNDSQRFDKYIPSFVSINYLCQFNWRLQGYLWGKRVF